MKKFFLTSILFYALSLSACGSSSTAEPVQPKSVESTEPITEETQAETPVAVEEQIIYNNDDIKVTVTGFDQDSSNVWLTVLAENNSDKDIILQSRKSSVNGYMCDFIFSCDVAAGKKANDKIKISNHDLDKCGIGKITDIEFVLCIADNTFTNNTYSDTIHITRNLVEPAPQVYDDSGDIAFENDSIKIVVKHMDVDSFGDASFWFYIENNSDSTVVIQSRNTSINGFMVNDALSCEVLPGKHAVDDISVWASELEKNSITDIEVLETSFHIISEDFMTTIADSDPITISY